MANLQEAEVALAKSKHELLSDLDAIAFALPGTIGADGSDSDSGREMKLLGLWYRFERRICRNERIKSLFLDDKVDRRAALVCAIADVLKFGGAVSLAALIVKEGMLTSCAKYWDDEDDDD